MIGKYLESENTDDYLIGLALLCKDAKTIDDVLALLRKELQEKESKNKIKHVLLIHEKCSHYQNRFKIA